MHTLVEGVGGAYSTYIAAVADVVDTTVKILLANYMTRVLT